MEYLSKLLIVFLSSSKQKACTIESTIIPKYWILPLGVAHERTQCAGLLSLRTVGATKNLPQNTASRFESTARDPKIPQKYNIRGAKSNSLICKGRILPTKRERNSNQPPPLPLNNEILSRESKM